MVDSEDCSLATKASFPRIIVAQMGSRMHYAVPLLLEKRGYLARFVTDAYSGEGSWLQHAMKWIPQHSRNAAFRRLEQRAANLPASKVVAFNVLGLKYYYALHKSTSDDVYATDLYLSFGRAFAEKAAKKVNLGDATAIYGSTGTNLELMKAAKEQGVTCLHEQISTPVGFRIPLLSDESERWKGWQLSSQALWRDDAWMTREEEEWEIADRVLVPSEHIFAKLVARGVPSDKIVTIPYAVSTESFAGSVHTFDGSRKLRVLFVGTVNLNKGVPYLLEALRLLGSDKVEALFVGTITLSREKLRQYDDVAQFLGKVSRSEVTRHYEWADVFALPSLSEGSAAVTYEARSCGLPIVVTPNTGAWVHEGLDGIVVPIQDSQRLAEALESFICNPDQVRSMSEIALQRSVDFSWDAYEKKLNDLILQVHEIDRR